MVLNKAMKDKVPVAIQEAQRHLNNDTFLMYDALVKKESHASKVTIITDSLFPSCLSHSNARIVNVK
jgi:hypothetical protein